jgi:hypothetical protein
MYTGLWRRLLTVWRVKNPSSFPITGTGDIDSLRVLLQYRLLKLHYQYHNHHVNPYVLPGSRNHCCDGNTTVRPLLIVVGTHIEVNNIRAPAVNESTCSYWLSHAYVRSQKCFLYLSGQRRQGLRQEEGNRMCFVLFANVSSDSGTTNTLIAAAENIQGHFKA